MSREKSCGIDGLSEGDWRLCELAWWRLGEITVASIFFFDDLHISGDASAVLLRCSVVRIFNLICVVCVCVFI